MKDSEEYRVKINTKKQSKDIVSLRDKLKYEVIGQDRAIRRLLRATASYFSGLKDPRRPIGGFIFAGPTGVGKTLLAKVFVRHFLGGKNKFREYLTRIDGSTLSLKHEITKLTGASPSFVGYDDPSVLSQENIDAYHFDIKARKDKLCDTNLREGTLLRLFRDLQRRKASSLYDKAIDKEQLKEDKALDKLYTKYKPYRSGVLFDEIEKAHKDIWDLLLQIMEEGEIQLGNGATTNFSNSMIILTTNIGQRNIQEMLKGGIGFSQPQASEINKRLDQQIYEAVKGRIEKKLRPELFKRLNLVVFRPLKKEDFIKILDNFLIEERARIKKQIYQTCRSFIKIEFSIKAKRFLLKKGVDIHYGARTLRSVVEKYIRTPIANGIASSEIKPGDSVLIDENNGKLFFSRKPRKKGRKPKPKKETGIMVSKFN